MRTFYFNTGVAQAAAHMHTPPITLGKGEVWHGGTKQVPFECEDVPEGAVFKFACDNPNLPEAKNCLVREIYNSTLISKYAYFTPRPPDLRAADVRALSLLGKHALGGKLTDAEQSELSRYNE